MSETTIWRHCGSCKKPISFNAPYYACTISTCTKNAYCSLDCFTMHVPVYRHKDAWAEERRSPREAHYVAPAATVSSDVPQDILIVASKLKDYIRAKSSMNTSANVLERLSDIVRRHCDRAIEHAAQEGRKTVMDRDFV